MGDRWIEQHACRSQCGIAIDLARHHGKPDTEECPQPVRLGNQRSFWYLPHQRRELIKFAKHHCQISRIGRTSQLRRPKEAQGRALQDHGPISVGLRQRRGEDRRTAHTVALKANIGTVNNGQVLQIGERGRPTKIVSPDIAAGITVARHIHGQNHETSSRQLNRKRALHLAGVDITVTNQHRRCRVGGINTARHIEQAGHAHALRCGEAHVRNGGTGGGLDSVRQQRTRQDQRDTQGRQHPIASHLRLPRRWWLARLCGDRRSGAMLTLGGRVQRQSKPGEAAFSPGS